MNPKGTGMRFIDAHLHTDMIEDVQLQKLVMMGMEAAVIPSPHMFVGTHDADTVLLLWERFLTMEATTAQTLGYEAFTSISVPFFGVNRADAEQLPRAHAGVPGQRPRRRHGRDRPRLRHGVRGVAVPRAPAAGQASTTCR